MKKIAIIISFVLLAAGAQAQDYNTGIGLRGGLSNGLTIKHFIKSNTAVEGILTSRWNGFNITGLYELHQQAFSTPGLNFYYGIGGHIGSWNDDKQDPTITGTQTVIGVDGIIGLEYNFAEVPFNISLDWKPAFNLVGYSNFWGDELALSIRFIF